MDEPATSILAWTTTPWTLPSNLGLAVGADIAYVKVKDGDEQYILAEERLGAYYKRPEQYTVVARYKGRELAGKAYQPLFPFFADLAAKGAFRTWNADFVSTEDGTGIVHIAPGFGEDDYNFLKGTGVPVVCPVDEEARFTKEVPDWAGRFVKDADKDIIRALKDARKLVRHESITHAYPHCWRCASPLIYRAVSSWFVSVEKIKPTMLAANDTVYWMPGHLKDGRFGKWLEGARDWAISRSRYWGNPLPIWRCDACTAMECIGSRAELEKKSGGRSTDLHKHFVDDITWPCSCGGTLRRIPEVLDCWFESGAMPYGQNHYPFEHKQWFDEHFPADFISESHRPDPGLVLHPHGPGGRPVRQAAFRSVVVSGLILDAEGKKMSKSQRNYTDPMEVIGTYGADAMRLFLVDSAGPEGRGPALLRSRRQGHGEERHHPALERLQLLRHLREHRRRHGRTSPGEAFQPPGPLDPLGSGADGAGGDGPDGAARPPARRGHLHRVPGPAHELVHPPLAPPVLEVGRGPRQARGLRHAARGPAEAVPRRLPVHALPRPRRSGATCARRARPTPSTSPTGRRTTRPGATRRWSASWPSPCAPCPWGAACAPSTA